MVGKYGTFICNRFIEHKKCFDPNMFDKASNIQLGRELGEIHYPKLTVMRGVEQTVYLFLNDVSKIATANKTITYHKEV